MSQPEEVDINEILLRPTVQRPTEQQGPSREPETMRRAAMRAVVACKP